MFLMIHIQHLAFHLDSVSFQELCFEWCSLFSCRQNSLDPKHGGNVLHLSVGFAGRSTHCLYDRNFQNHTNCQAIWSMRQGCFQYKLDMSPLLFYHPCRIRNLMYPVINWLGQYYQALNMICTKLEESSQQLCLFLGSSKMQLFILKGMLCHEVVEYVFCKFFTLETDRNRNPSI